MGYFPVIVEGMELWRRARAGNLFREAWLLERELFRCFDDCFDALADAEPSAENAAGYAEVNAARAELLAYPEKDRARSGAPRC